MSAMRPGPSPSLGHPTAAPYRHEGGVALVEIRLARVDQLFNSLDHAPFLEKDLDDDAEQYIVGAVRDFSVRSPVRLVLHLPSSELDRVDPAGIETAIRHYFGYRLWGERRRLRNELRTGLVSLAIGLSFLMACILLRRVAEASLNRTWAEILGEGLLISGWVAMWRPIEIFLFDWWPIWQSCRLHAKLAQLPVECRALGSAS